MDEISQLLAMVWAFIQGMGDMSIQAKIAGGVLILISAWKSSLLKPVYDKLGAAKVLVAPVLGMIAGILSIEPLSLAAVWAGIQGGVLAIALHQLLDAVKAMPWVGDKYKAWIDLISGILLKPKAK